ncbi:uncharacterized protein TNCV_486271 [Trichonephila clavipes]|nr:uncharacterized protein TNCV_486271 [Trichonephila clavipes]
MAPHTITPAAGVVCRCKAKAGLKRLPRTLHTRTRLSSLLRLKLDSSLKMTWFHSTAVHFRSFSHIVFKNGVMACLPQLFLSKRFSTLKQALVTCFILHGERL